MSANLYLPGDEIIDQTLAEFMGYFWCRYASGQVVGERIVRFLVAPDELAVFREKFGPLSMTPAAGSEPVEQLAFKPVPPYHGSRDEMAKVEAKLYQSQGLSQIYLNHLRAQLKAPTTGPLTPDAIWQLLLADARARASAAFITIDAQRPKQQALFG